MYSPISAHQCTPFKEKPIFAESLAPVRLVRWSFAVLFKSVSVARAEIRNHHFPGHLSLLICHYKALIFKHLFCFLILSYCLAFEMRSRVTFEMRLALNSLCNGGWLCTPNLSATVPSQMLLPPALRLYLNAGRSSPSHSPGTSSVPTSVTSLNLVSSLLVVLRPFCSPHLKHVHPHSGCSSFFAC